MVAHLLLERCQPTADDLRRNGLRPLRKCLTQHLAPVLCLREPMLLLQVLWKAAIVHRLEAEPAMSRAQVLWLLGVGGERAPIPLLAAPKSVARLPRRSTVAALQCPPRTARFPILANLYCSSTDFSLMHFLHVCIYRRSFRAGTRPHSTHMLPCARQHCLHVNGFDRQRSTHSLQ